MICIQRIGEQAYKLFHSIYDAGNDSSIIIYRMTSHAPITVSLEVQHTSFVYLSFSAVKNTA